MLHCGVNIGRPQSFRLAFPIACAELLSTSTIGGEFVQPWGEQRKSPSYAKNVEAPRVHAGHKFLMRKPIRLERVLKDE
jgi:hypothetical protein